MLRTSDLEYELAPGCVATRAMEPRDAARLMVVDRAGGVVEHRRVRDLVDVLREGDLLVVNVSRVLAARFVGRREDSGGAVEGLYLRDAGAGERAGSRRWVAMVKARRFRAGAPIRLLARDGEASGYVMRLVERVAVVGDVVGAEWVVEVSRADSAVGATPTVLGEVGAPPIPPYIVSARRGSVETTGLVEADTASYQTVYAGGLTESADGSEVGSVAAPTAGLHFTAELLQRLSERGVQRAEVVLHVGAGTFKPVETEYVEQHPMHAEWCSMSGAAREAILRTRASGGRVVCVGTTAARTVEAFAAAEEAGQVNPSPLPPHRSTDPERGEVGGWLHTQLLISPGYRWRWTDGLMTNFHLPRSTLMALVAAMLPGGVEKLKRLYAEAMASGYRFYSYGDAMVLV